MNKKDLIYPDLSYKLAGVCFEAHNEIGSYGREKQYGDFIEKKLRELSIPFKREVMIADSGNIVDFSVDNKIILELKNKRVLTKKDYYQVQRYLHSTNCKLGLLVNFRDRHIKPRRIIKVERNP